MSGTANTDYTQATIEIFGAIIIFTLATMFKIVTEKKKKSEKDLFALLVLAGISLLLDAGWYMHDGDTNKASCIANQICNFLLFLCNPFMLAHANGYLCRLIEEKGNGSSSKYKWMGYALSGLTTLIPISNIFYQWMYYIDEQNIYCRLDGWIIYTTLNTINLLVLVVMIVRQKNLVSFRHRIAMYIFFASPFIGIILQAFNLGISFIQIGTAIGCVGILVSYLHEWITQVKDSYEANSERKNFWLIECVFFIMTLCVTAAIVSCVVSVKKVSSETSTQNSISMAYMINGTVENALTETIDVSKTMAKSPIVLDALSTLQLQGTIYEKKMISYMHRLKEEYGYQTIFVASENSKAYYSHNGISRYMNTKSDPKDAWYNEFKERNIKYELNVDYDKDADMALSVFVNVEVRDEDGNFLGVCGVATSIDSILGLLTQYSNTWNLDISLVNAEGLIQVDIDSSKIGTDSIDLSGLTLADSEDIYYSRSETDAVLIKYIEEFDWYLVIKDKNPDKINVLRIIVPSITIYLIGILLMLTFALLFNVHEKKRSRDLRLSRRLSELDSLTGLNNRYSMDRFVESIEKNGFPDYLSVVMIDLNGLKTANDTLGHDAGDELIKGATDCMLRAFRDEGTVYRIGGDEFLITTNCDETELKLILSSLDKYTNSWRGVKAKELSLSIGYASHTDFPDYSITELMKEADNNMYKAKSEYYTRTGKDRRVHNCNLN